MLKIYDIKADKIIKILKFHGSIYVCKFTFDSSKLYVISSYENNNSV